MFADRKSNPYVAPWRVDCRLARELPDDKPIRSHFIFQLLAVLVCSILLLVVGWQSFRLHTLSNSIATWQRTMADERQLYDEVRRARQDITADARKIGEAAGLLPVRILTFDFLTIIGRTRPAPVWIDQIESAESGLVVRGRLEDSPEKASRMLGKYVADLRADARLSAKFGSIVLTAMERRGEAAELSFEITFRYR
jgi:hypothetical protein